jgi:hypothetical protein
VRREACAPAALATAFLLLLATARPAAAAETAGLFSSQLHLRTGLLSGSYSTSSSSGQSTTPTDVSVPFTLDAEYERFLSRRHSYFLRGNFSLDTSRNQVVYFYAGGGARWYLGAGTGYEGAEPETRVSATPRSRFFVGADLGFANTVVNQFQSVSGTTQTPLVISAGMLDVGVHAGWIYQTSRRLGIELLGGVAQGFGVSSVTVSGRVLRALLGICYTL